MRSIADYHKIFLAVIVISGKLLLEELDFPALLYLPILVRCRRNKHNSENKRGNRESFQVLFIEI